MKAFAGKFFRVILIFILLTGISKITLTWLVDLLNYILREPDCLNAKILWAFSCYTAVCVCFIWFPVLLLIGTYQDLKSTGVNK